MKIQFQKITEDAVIPKYATPGSSGMDLFANEDVHFNLWETKLVPVGFAVDVGPGYEMQIRPRSGLSLNTGLKVSNSPGTVDSDFRGQVCVIMSLFPDGKGTVEYTIKKGNRIAQAVISPVVQADIEVVKELNNTQRNSGGFGSTGS